MPVSLTPRTPTLFAHIAAGLALAALLAGCTVLANPSSELDGSEWRLQTLDGDELASSNARFKFTGDQLRASAGCNTMTGNWRVEDSRLLIGPLMQTEMYCAGPTWEQEKTLGALLASAPVLSNDDKWTALTLTSRGHSAELVRITKP
ncbi:MAG: META domain-containing protein [Novosphingobium sp.]|nr:META domain-containing protein [Novosphingobium sp.]